MWMMRRVREGWVRGRARAAQWRWRHRRAVAVGERVSLPAATAAVVGCMAGAWAASGAWAPAAAAAAAVFLAGSAGPLLRFHLPLLEELLLHFRPRPVELAL